MKIEEIIKLAMARMIEANDCLYYTNVVVSDWNEEFERGGWGGCDTCNYGGTEDEYSVTIYFTADQTDRGMFQYRDSFASLIKELDANG